MRHSNELVGFAYFAEEYKFTELTGVKMRDYYNDTSLMVATQRRANKIISEALDVPPQDVFYTRGHVKCPEYMGCEVFWPEDDEPFVRSPVLKEIGDVDSFVCPDPSDNPVARDSLRRAREFYDLTGAKPSIGPFEGPFTTAAFMRGQTEFMTDWVDRPSLCEKLIGLVTDAVIAWKKWHDAEMGLAPQASTDLVDDSICLISPGDFEEMVLPHLVRWFEAFPAPEKHFHCCGDITAHMSALSKLRLTHYDGMGEMVDVPQAKQAFKGAYISRLFDFRILRDGSDDDILAYTMDTLERAHVGGDFGILVEGGRRASLGKARTVKDAVQEFNGGVLPPFNQRTGART